MHEYALTAAALRHWQERELPDDPREQVDFWADLLDAFGPALLPFVLKPAFLERVPYKILGLAPIDVRDMTPDVGESWLLFCFRTGAAERSASPVRGDGLLLPCEWRCRPAPATGGHSPLLADGLKALSDQVKAALEGGGWYLYPSFGRFADRVAFTDPELFAPADCPGLVASAWSALATGLFFAQRDMVPHAWPFSSIQCDPASGRLLPVAGMAQKLSVAAGFRCRVFMVAPAQVASAYAELKALAVAADDPALRERLRAMTVAAPVVSKDIAVTIEDLATGTARRKRRRTACGAIGVLLLAAGLAFGVWHYVMRICTVTEYYSTAFRCRDGWEGRGRVPQAVAAKRVGNVRFLREGLRGYVKEVAWVDGLAMPSRGYDFCANFDNRLILKGGDDWGGRHVRFVLRREAGRLTEERAYDVYGRELYCLNYLERGGPQYALFTKNRDLHASAKHDVVQLAFSYDEKGREKEVRFLDGIGRPSVNIDGICGYATGYEEEDAPDRMSVTRTFLSTNRGPAYVKNGMAKIKSVFDERWCLKCVLFLDGRDELIQGSRGFAAVSYRHDGFGNPSSCVMLDINADETIVAPSFGYASVSNAYDKAGNHVYGVYHDASGRLVWSVGGSAARQALYNTQTQPMKFYHFLWRRLSD